MSAVAVDIADTAVYEPEPETSPACLKCTGWKERTGRLKQSKKNINLGDRQKGVSSLVRVDGDGYEGTSFPPD